MKNFYHLLLSTVMILMTTATFAQTAALRGSILDESNLPFPGAIVLVEELSKGTVTDVNGRYTLTDIPAGDYSIKVSYLGYKPVSKTISVSGTTVLDFNLTELETLDEVTIYAGGQAKALNQQKNANNIVNVISADQVSRFPDSNIGDALKRVSGIYVQYDQGEARFANIRGTAPQLNSVTINGERVPSAEAEIRSVQLDLVPSDMVQAVEVNKAVTPDMDGDAIGGSVNLVTRTAPHARRISATLGSGYNFIGKKPILNGSLVYGNRFVNDKLGVIASGSVFNHYLGSDNVEAEWDGDDLVEFQTRQYYVQRLRQSFSLGLDYKINDNHTLFVKGMYNHRNDWETRYRVSYKDLVRNDGDNYTAEEIVRETKGGANNKNQRLEDQRVLTLGLSGDHLFGKVRFDWGVNYAKASEDRPQERYIAYKTENQSLDFSMVDDKPLPSNSFEAIDGNWELDEITEENQYTQEEDFSGKFNISMPLSQGNFASNLKFGAKYKSKSKERDNNFYEIEPTDEDALMALIQQNLSNETKDDFLAGDYKAGSFVSKEFLGGTDFTSNAYESEIKLDEMAGNFNATENVTAGYLMLDQKLGKKLNMLAGVRIENTSVTYSGFEYNDNDETLEPTAEQTNDYMNILPGLHFRYQPADNAVVRLAWTNTIARPNYFDLVPYVVIEDEEMSIGNPALEATTSMNFDLLGEYYFSSVGIVSGGVFYKKVNDFIVKNTNDEMIGGTEFEVTQPINGGDANLMGVELGLQRRLDFLPYPLNRFNVYANYTYINSSVENFQLEDREDEDLSMPGTANNTFNASLMYEAKKFKAGLSFNYTSEFIEEVGGDVSEDVYYDKVMYLDANASYMFSEKVNAYVEANNLLNQPLRYFQGVSNHMMQAEYYAPRFSIGVKINL
ncbi:TonB-dependent receptor [Limibacter armeniacum]|uniref:TonB-dependent receptor n=1 Tax=Limibacter armeniacum TaxID=466084 RepID=UPI002FE68BDD